MRQNPNDERILAIMFGSPEGQKFLRAYPDAAIPARKTMTYAGIGLNLALRDLGKSIVDALPLHLLRR